MAPATKGTLSVLQKLSRLTVNQSLVIGIKPFYFKDLAVWAQGALVRLDDVAFGCVDLFEDLDADQ
jgi:hypothetical protein